MKDKMPEAEVSLRLAAWLISEGHVEGEVQIAIDGAQVKTLDVVHFPIARFLKKIGATPLELTEAWTGRYAYGPCTLSIVSKSGVGDVVAKMVGGGRLRVESKKGTLTRSNSSSEYPLIREALGQLLTTEHVEPGDVMAVAVPHSDKFQELAARWRSAPLVAKAGLKILTVSTDGSVHGLPQIAPQS